jgi:hypothetical protein
MYPTTRCPALAGGGGAGGGGVGGEGVGTGLGVGGAGVGGGVGTGLGVGPEVHWQSAGGQFGGTALQFCSYQYMSVTNFQRMQHNILK